ncbi:MAG: nucleotidyltransferase domain-containing protein [Candidatus Hydrothermarchaeota archaeon]
MNTRIRDFIYTKEDMFFAVNSYFSPDDRIFSSLRYIPCERGGRIRENRRYCKVGDTEMSYEYLRKNFRDYIYDCRVTNIEQQAVPKKSIVGIFKPEERLKEIVEDPKDELENKLAILASEFENHGIPFDKMGISGSLLVKLHDKDSDIDFVVYGRDNFEESRKILKDALMEENKIKDLTDKLWMDAYRKRIKDDTLSFQEFLFYERRKYNRGMINGTYFDILYTRDWNEIKEKYGDLLFYPREKILIEASVLDSKLAFDYPAVYEVEGVKVLESDEKNLENELNIKQVVSYTHTYAGQAFNGEKILVKGRLERVSGLKEFHRVVVGTTREAIGEYIKVKG